MPKIKLTDKEKLALRPVFGFIIGTRIPVYVDKKGFIEYA